MGATHFLTKRLPKVATEMALNVLAYNMKRVMAIIGVAGLRGGLGDPSRRKLLLANFAKIDILTAIRGEWEMPTRNISLTPEQDDFVEKVVKAGEYQNASEAIRDALRSLQQRRREDALKLKALRTQIKAGVDALERGEFVEIDDSDLDDYLEGLTTAPRVGAR